MHCINLIQQCLIQIHTQITWGCSRFVPIKDKKKRKEPEQEAAPEILGENCFFLFFFFVGDFGDVFYICLFALQGG